MSSQALGRRPATPIAFVRGVVAAYAKYGISPSDAFTKAQIPATYLKAADARVTAAQFETLAGYAMCELDDEALGWFGRKLPWGTYGMLARASITAPCLELALKRWIRHHRILTEDILFELTVSNDIAVISVVEFCKLGKLREFCLVTLLRNMLGYSCWMINSAIPLRSAEFPYAEPRHVSVYPTIFCKNTRFDATRASISFDARYLSLPVKRTSDDLDRMLKRALRLTVLPYRRDSLVVERVRRLLIEERGRTMRTEEIAGALAMSTRTLHRKLRAESTSLRELKQEAKLQLAKQALARGAAPIKRVAGLVGFRNEKSFSRAFHSWTGVSPGDFRTKNS